MIMTRGNDLLTYKLLRNNLYHKEVSLNIMLSVDTMLLVLCLVWFLLQEMLTIDVFVSKDSTICLRCPSREPISSIVWFGPPNDMLYIAGDQVQSQFSEIYLNHSTEQSVLCIGNVTSVYTGNYSCHGFENKNKSSYTVIIQAKPTNMVIEPIHSGSVTISEDQETVLSCRITQGKPAGVLRWTFKNRTFVSNVADRVSVMIIPTSSDNEKVYTCQALDITGKVALEKSVKISVQGRPVTPSLIESVVMPTSVTINWNPMYDGGFPQTFVVQYRRYEDHLVNEENNTWFNATVFGHNHVVLQNLSSGTHYSVRMYAYNKVNRSEYSVEILVTTSHSRYVTARDSNSYSSAYYAVFGVPVVIVIAAVIKYLIKGSAVMRMRTMSIMV